MALQPAVVALARCANTRSNYITTALAALRAVRYVVYVNSTDRSHNVDRETIDIIDDLNELPNTCSFECFGFTPAVDQVVKITYAGPTNKEFEGTIVSVTEAHDKLNGRTVYRIQCTDYTRLLDKQLVTKAYGSQSATTTAQDIITNFSSGFTQVNIGASLPTVPSIQFKMTPVSSALRQLCDAIGGDTYIDYDKDVHVFLTETDVLPDQLTTTSTNWKAFKYSRMIDRVVNRILVEGMGTQVIAGLDIGETMIPVLSTVPFLSSGGSVVVGNQILTYTAITGVRPTTAVSGSPIPGSGLANATYQYAYTFVTASGETIASPLATVVVTGLLAAPSTGPSLATTLAVGALLTAGVYKYAVTFITAAGETTTSPVSQVTTTVMAAPGAVQVANNGAGTLSGTYGYATTFVTAAGETTPSATASLVTAGNIVFVGNNNSLPIGPTGTTSRNIYRTVSGGSQLKFLATVANNTATFYGNDNAADGTLGANAPTTNTAGCIAVALTAIPLGPTGVTSRNVYRTAVDGSQLKLRSTIADNTTTTLTDTTADASLTTNAPTSGTATANQVALTGITVGPTGTTSRKVYRTLGGGSSLLLQSTIADNTTTTATDSTADASLGAAAPTSDTSGFSSIGFSTTSGSTSANATTMTLASTTAFNATGGWARIGGSAIRYTSTSGGTTLTGIPASGSGSITATIPSGTLVESAFMLTGVPSSGTGAVVNSIANGDELNLLVQRDDTTSQGTYGIRYAYIQDRRLSIAGANARGDAELTLRKDPFISGSYTTTDTKVRSGRRVTIAMSDWSITGTYLITKVRIYWKIGDQHPQREVTFASNAGQNDLFRLLRRIREDQRQKSAA